MSSDWFESSVAHSLRHRRCLRDGNGPLCSKRVGSNRGTVVDDWLRSGCDRRPMGLFPPILLDRRSGSTRPLHSFGRVLVEGRGAALAVGQGITLILSFWCRGASAIKTPALSISLLLFPFVTLRFIL